MSMQNISVIPITKNNQKLESSQTDFKRRVCAYCRVSTDSDEQQTSYDMQKTYYENYIIANDDWELAGIFADEGLTGTNTINRPEFNRMIKVCKQNKIDLILTKSISRFARNTVDCLSYIRELKAIDVEIYFEKENIRTLDATGEVIITILSSLAQEESRSISENVKWGIRKRFQNGIVRVSSLYGYAKDVDKNLINYRPE